MSSLALTTDQQVSIRVLDVELAQPRSNPPSSTGIRPNLAEAARRRPLGTNRPATGILTLSGEVAGAERLATHSMAYSLKGDR